MSMPERTATTAGYDASQSLRRSMTGKIMVARKQLNMVEDDYRAGLFAATGRTSLRDCNEAQLARMLDWLKGKGFRPLPPKGTAQHPMARKARALWISLAHLGVVHNPAEAALEAFAKRQLKCERMIWARQSDAFRLIEALKAMAERAGWHLTDAETGKPLSPLTLQRSLCDAILSRLKAAGGAAPDWALHDAAWRLCGIENGRERAWTADDYALLAKGLGDHLRSVTGSAGR